MADHLTISFEGPFSWPGAPGAPSVFEVELARHAGIYLFTVPLNEGHLVYYVGQTGTSFATRLLEHYREHASGMYHLYSPREFARGEKVLLWPGRYDPTDKKSPIECILNCFRLGEQIRELAYLYQFLLAPTSCERRTRQRIEAAIASTLYAAPGMIGAFQDRGIRYLPRAADEEPIACAVTSAVPLLGIPEPLWV